VIQQVAGRVSCHISEHMAEKIGKRYMLLDPSKYQRVSENGAVISLGSQKYKAEIVPYFNKEFRKMMYYLNIVASA
jgi:hypothetical protein